MITINQAHAAAMSAKQAVFKAQDAVSAAWDTTAPGDRKVLRKMERRLALVRAHLEALDRETPSWARANAFQASTQGTP